MMGRFVNAEHLFHTKRGVQNENPFLLMLVYAVAENRLKQA